MARHDIFDFSNPHSVGMMNNMMREIYTRLQNVEEQAPSGSLTKNQATGTIRQQYESGQAAILKDEVLENG